MADDEHRDESPGKEREPMLSPLPPPRPALHEVPRQHGAGWEGMARSYMTLAAHVNQHLPCVYGELDEMRAAINTLPERVDLAVRAALHHDRKEHGDWDRRRKLPSLSEYDPEYTPAGGIKFDERQFAALSQRMAALDAQIEEAKQAAELAAAEKRGAEQARVEIERAAALRDIASAKFRKDVMFWIKVAAAVVPTLVAAITYAVTHLAKL